MKLRHKVLIVISVVWIIFIIFTYISSKVILKRYYLVTEHSHYDDSLYRVKQALDEMGSSLLIITSDWTHWNHSKSGLISNNMNLTAFIKSHLNVSTFWDLSNKLVFGTSIDTINKKFAPYPQGLENYLYPGGMLLDRKAANKEIVGYVLTRKGIMLIAAAPATDGEKIFPPLGTIVNAEYLDAALINKIAHRTKYSLTLYTPDQIAKSTTLKHIYKIISINENGQYISLLNENVLEGFSIIKDVNGKPIAMLAMSIPRSIYENGILVIHYYLISFIILGIIFFFLIMWLFHILILKRLERADATLAEISAKHGMTQRLPIDGNDEISSVSSKINQMLDIIELTHKELEKKVQERTQQIKQIDAKLQQEMTERQSVEHELTIHKEHLVQLAHYDNLTTLPNRVFFNEILNKAISHAKRHNRILAVLFIDIDRFKNINDAAGYPGGDLVLKEVGERFNKLLRSGDMLARLGGDEFIILLNDIPHANLASSVAKKILDACKEPILINDHEFFVTVSIGISIFPEDGDSLEDLQKNADMAMYKAKRAGGGLYQYYTHEMNAQAHEHIKLESELRHAIQNNEFVLYFQPQLNVKEGIVEQVEALIRWEHPTLGLILPAKFIPLAEETGLIMAIGEWALRAACSIAKSWQDEGYDPIIVAVNISPKQFRHQDIVQLVADALKTSKLDPQYLEIEITESTVMENVDVAINTLTSIRAMGVRIAVDDFGTGYTSINYLRKFPVNVLKIDQSFIKGIPYDQNNAAITSAVIALGHNLGLQVIAEGAETAEQLQFLTEHQCDLIQGYFLSRPLPERKIILQFRKHGRADDPFLLSD